jgi:hypothetical protein
MRQPIRVPQLLRYLLILGALCFAVRAHADDRSEARAHYQAGVKMYGSGDYQGAIREFSAAQQLAPADLNNYNLALCYDKLGDAEPAIQYYRAFLDKQPGSDKRAEIEASISRLEAASRSAATKRAEDARKAEEARRAPPPPAGPVQGPAPGPTAGPPPGPAPVAGPVMGPDPGPGAPAPEVKRPGPVTQAPAPAIGGSIGTPSTATPVPTGDSQLDRVNSINIDEVRDQRGMGGAGGAAGRPMDHLSASGPGGPRSPAGPGGPAVAANDPMPPGQPGGGAALAPSDQPGGSDQPKKETPVYKKWWFWVIVPVVGYVAYNLVSSGSSSSTRARELPLGNNASTQPGGLTLLRW